MGAMTTAQQMHDLELAAAMIRMANWIEPRSKKVSQMLMLGAQRIQALAGLPIDLPPPQQPALSVLEKMPTYVGETTLQQPASTPVSNR